MRITGEHIYMPDGRFAPGEIRTGENGTIMPSDMPSGTSSGGSEIFDAGDAYVIPGLVDIHLHGAAGSDFCDGTREAFARIAGFEASCGVTTICPATLTLPEEELLDILSTGRAFAEASKDDPALASIAGFNMEGPFISPGRRGAQNEAYILPFDPELAMRFQKAAGGSVRFLGIAPERCVDAEEKIRRFLQEPGAPRLALSHSDADYETALSAIRAGVSHATHLFNAMPPMDKRAPGIAGAVLDSPSVTAEIICDGIHVHPSLVRAVSTLLEGRLAYISDSLRCTGMEDGPFVMGGLAARKAGKKCTLEGTGTLAGSASTLFDCLKTAVNVMGIPLEDALPCATSVPAAMAGLSGKAGSLACGCDADILIIDRDMELLHVFHKGVKLK